MFSSSSFKIEASEPKSVSVQSYKKNDLEKQKKLKYNTSKIYENFYFNEFEDYIDPQYNAKRNKPMTQQLDRDLLQQISKYNKKLLEISRLNAKSSKKTDNKYVFDMTRYQRFSTKQYPDDTLIKSQRLLKQKIFELTLMEALLNSSSYHLKMDIDEVYVVYFSDFKKSDFRKDNKLCCVEIPILLSTGEMMEADNYFTNDKKYELSHNGKIFNHDFTCVPYINRFLSCIIHLRMYNLKVKSIKKNTTFNYFEIKLEWVNQNREFVLRCPPLHYQVLVEFMKDHNLYIKDKDKFVYIDDGSRDKFGRLDYQEKIDFPILKYKHFRKIFQSSFYYDDSSEYNPILFKPISSVNNGYTIDLADFEEYENSHTILQIDNDNDQIDITQLDDVPDIDDQSDVDYSTDHGISEIDNRSDEQDGSSSWSASSNKTMAQNDSFNEHSFDVLYQIGQELFLPNIAIMNFSNKIMSKELKCNLKGELCFKQ